MLGPYKIVSEVEKVFINLRRHTGETLQAKPGDVVLLHDESEDAVAAHVAAGDLVKTDEVPTPHPAPKPAVDDAEVEAAKAATLAAIEAQRVADEQAKAQALLDAEAVKAKQEADEAAAKAAAEQNPPA